MRGRSKALVLAIHDFPTERGTTYPQSLKETTCKVREMTEERTFVIFDTEDNTWQSRNLTTMAPESRTTRWRPWREFCSRRYRNSSRARRDSGSSRSGRSNRNRNNSKRLGVPIGRPAICRSQDILNGNDKSEPVPHLEDSVRIIIDWSE